MTTARGRGRPRASPHATHTCHSALDTAHLHARIHIGTANARHHQDGPRQIRHVEVVTVLAVKPRNRFRNECRQTVRGLLTGLNARQPLVVRGFIHLHIWYGPLLAVVQLAQKAVGGIVREGSHHHHQARLPVRENDDEEKGVQQPQLWSECIGGREGEWKGAYGLLLSVSVGAACAPCSRASAQCGVCVRDKCEMDLVRVSAPSSTRW
eukprot:3633746-Prymnesium_polylepis.1